MKMGEFRIPHAQPLRASQANVISKLMDEPNSFLYITYSGENTFGEAA